MENNGDVTVDSDASFGTGDVTGGVIVGTSYITWVADNSAVNYFDLEGMNLGVATGATLTLDGAGVVSGYLYHAVGYAGTFSTDATDGAEFGDMTSYANVVSNSPVDRFVNFTNRGNITVSAGVNSANTSTTVNFDGFTNYTAATVEIEPSAKVNVADWVSNGLLVIDNGYSASAADLTLFQNVGGVGLGFGIASDTEISNPTDGGNSDLYGGIDLGGYDATVDGTTANPAQPGALFNNNGFVYDSSLGGTATIIVDGNYTYKGALAKGTGFYQNTVITQHGGVFQAGDCPGTQQFGAFTFGPGGVNNDLFQITDASGTAGQVDGNSLIVAEAFAWTASAENKLTVNLETLTGTTSLGHDVTGSMENFDPTHTYTWTAVTWTGTYTGPTDVAALNASTVFDASAFANTFNGTFGSQLDTVNKTLSLVYTPNG